MNQLQDYTREQIIKHLYYVQYLRRKIDYNFLPVPGKISYKRPYSSSTATTLSHIHYYNTIYFNNLQKQGSIIIHGN